MPAPGGRLAGAGHSESPSRSSVISQRRGGWRRGTAMPIAARMPADDPAHRLAEVHAAIASAARTAGRPRDAVMLIAVSKTHPVAAIRSEEHTSELQSLMRSSYAVFCLKKKKKTYI